MDDVDVLSREQVVVVLVPVDAEGLGERVELLPIGPRGRDQFGARILRQRSREVVGRVPVTEAKDGDTELTAHECSTWSVSSSPYPVSSRKDQHLGKRQLGTGNWKLQNYATIPSPARIPNASNYSHRSHR